MTGQWHGGKGSRPRAFSVDQQTFSDNWERIFGKKKKEEEMTPKVEDAKQGTCGCGRSPTGDCCGWHGLTEAEYQTKKAEWEMAEYRKTAEKNWYNEDGSLK